jgi:putative transposase
VQRRSEQGEWEIINFEGELPIEVEQRMEVIQRLMAVRGTDCYGQMQQRAAQRLGSSLRSVQRLIKSWQEQGIAGLSRQMRSDQGVVRISPDWQHIILKTYQGGNCGSCRMSPAQVHLRVRVRAH